MTLERTIFGLMLAITSLTVLDAPLYGGQPAVWQPYRPLPDQGLNLAPRLEHQSSPLHAAHVESISEIGFEPQPAYCGPPGSGEVIYDVIDNYGPGFNSNSPQLWQWLVLPEGVMWHSYLAGVREPRISGVVYADNNGIALLDVTLGGRAAILRYGSDAPTRPQGWEFEIEGAALPRLNLDQNWDLESVDFRFGMPIVYSRDNWQYKFSYYHLSAHLGDELAIREMGRLDERINFSRDVFVAGFSYYALPAWRWYAEAGYAFHNDGGSEPWEFQFGVDVAAPGATGAQGTPYFAVNGHLREELDYGGNLVVQTGWLWRGTSGRVVRTGFHYFNGKSSQFEFFNTFEQQIGGGLWAEY